MSLEEFHVIFKRQIENELSRLYKKSCTSSPRSSTGSRRLSEGNTGDGQLDPAHLEPLRRLSAGMADNVLQRVADIKASWEEETGSEPSVLAVQHGAEAEVAAGRERLEAKCRRLDEELRHKQAEVAQKSEEVLRGFKAEVDRRLQRREQEIAEIRRAAACDLPETASDDGGSTRDLTVHRELVEHVGRIQTSIAETREALGSLETRKQGLEKIEAQQSQPLPSEEALLAGALVSDAMGDEQDRALQEKIQQGEEVCKRMRRHVAGA